MSRLHTYIYVYQQRSKAIIARESMRLCINTILFEARPHKAISELENTDNFDIITHRATTVVGFAKK